MHSALGPMSSSRLSGRIGSSGSTCFPSDHSEKISALTTESFAFAA